MSSINVISINPAQNAKSALHPEVFERIAREYRADMGMRKVKLAVKKPIDFFFGINKNVSRSKSFSLLISRLVSGGGLIALSIFQGLSLSIFSPAWIMLFLGISLFFGLFTRMISFVAAGFLGYYTTLSVMATATPDFSDILPATISILPILVLATPALISLVFTIAGPGKFSTDQLIRRAIIRRAKRNVRSKARKLAEKRLSYQAMRYLYN